MGFWKELKKQRRSPYTGMELKFSIIENVIPIPHEVSDQAKACAICRVQFGKIFAKNVQPFLVVVHSETHLSFQESNYVVVCERCVNRFEISETKTL